MRPDLRTSLEDLKLIAIWSSLLRWMPAMRKKINSSNAYNRGHCLPKMAIYWNEKRKAIQKLHEHVFQHLWWRWQKLIADCYFAVSCCFSFCRSAPLGSSFLYKHWLQNSWMLSDLIKISGSLFTVPALHILQEVRLFYHLRYCTSFHN